jgi:hypothetical protein
MRRSEESDEEGNLVLRRSVAWRVASMTARASTAG